MYKNRIINTKIQSYVTVCGKVFRLLLDNQQLRGSINSHHHPHPSPPTTSPPIMVRWFLPPPSAFEFKFDCSYKLTVVATCIIIRDSTNKTYLAITFNLDTTQIFMTEAMALHKGLQEVI